MRLGPTPRGAWRKPSVAAFVWFVPTTAGRRRFLIPAAFLAPQLRHDTAFYTNRLFWRVAVVTRREGVRKLVRFFLLALGVAWVGVVGWTMAHTCLNVVMGVLILHSTLFMVLCGLLILSVALCRRGEVTGGLSALVGLVVGIVWVGCMPAASPRRNQADLPPLLHYSDVPALRHRQLPARVFNLVRRLAPAAYAPAPRGVTEDLLTRPGFYNPAVSWCLFNLRADSARVLRGNASWALGLAHGAAQARLSRLLQTVFLRHLEHAQGIAPDWVARRNVTSRAVWLEAHAVAERRDALSSGGLAEQALVVQVGGLTPVSLAHRRVRPSTSVALVQPLLAWHPGVRAS